MSNQKLNLEIPFKSINNWMQDRRLLSQDWVKSLKAAQIKSEQLRSQFPATHQEEAVKRIKQQITQNGEDFLYKDAKDIFTTLTTQTEEGRQKTFFGRYKSPLVNDWQLLLRIYETDLLYLAEYGKIVQQVHGFDIPAARKQLQTMTRQVTDGQQKKKDLKRLIGEQDKKFNEDCHKMGIAPTIDASSMERQSIQMVEQLIPKFKDVESLIQSKTIRDLIEFYQEFNSDPQALQMLQYISKHGDENLAVYNYKRSNPGIKNLSQDLIKREQHKYDLYTRYDKIVFHEDEVVDIDITGGDDVAASGSIDLDWSQIEEASNATANGGQGADWEIVNKDAASDPHSSNNATQHNEEETLLYNQETRQQLINDLEEVEFFLRQRYSELTQKDAATYSMYIEATQRKEIVKQCDQAEFVKSAISQVEKIQAALNHKDLLQLMLIRQKPKIAAQRMVQKLMLPIKLKEKYEQAIITIDKKEKDLTKEIEQAKRSIESDEKVVKELVAIIQTDLSEKLKANVRVSL